jgi:LysM repeat protein
VSPVALAQANQLAATATLEDGAHLVVPMGAGNDASLVRVREAAPHQLVHYRVRPGDTEDLIADRYDVSVYQIRRWNGLASSKLTPGRTLRLYIEAPASAASKGTHTHGTANSKHPAARTVAVPGKTSAENGHAPATTAFAAH